MIDTRKPMEVLEKGQRGTEEWFAVKRFVECNGTMGWVACVIDYGDIERLVISHKNSARIRNKTEKHEGWIAVAKFPAQGDGLYYVVSCVIHNSADEAMEDLDPDEFVAVKVEWL